MAVSRAQVYRVFLLFFVFLHLVSCKSKIVENTQVENTFYIDSLNSRAYAQLRVDRDTSVLMAKKCLELSEQSNYAVGKANALSILGINYAIELKYDSAIALYRQALDIRRRTEHPIDEGKSFSNIGEVYQSLGDYRKAIAFTDSAAKIFLDHDSISYLSGIFGNQAISYDYMDKLDSAEAFFKLSLYYADLDSVHPRTLLNAYKNYAIFIQYQGEIDTSIYYVNKALDVAIENHLYSDFGGLYLTLGDALQGTDPDKVERLYDSALVLAQKFDLPDLKALIYDAKLEMFWGEEDTLIRQTYDSVYFAMVKKYNKTRLEDFAEFEVKYKTAEKEAQNKSLRALSEQKTKRQRLLILLVVVLGLSIVLVVRSLLLTKKIAKRDVELQEKRIDSIIQNQELEKIDHMIEVQEAERSRIAQDLHDRLGSLLGALKLNFGTIDEQHADELQKTPEPYNAVKNLIHESTIEVRRISHDMASGVLAKFGLVEAIYDLKNILESSGKVKISFHENGREERLSSHQEITIYRVVQEVVSNALKHANPNEIEIHLTKSKHQIMLIIEDDGTGFDVANAEGGIGLQNMKKRVESIGGTLDIDSHVKSGTTITIELALEDA